MAPFKLGKDNAFHIQSIVLIATIPLILWGTFVFGTRAITLLLTSIFFSTLFDISFHKITKKAYPFSPIKPIISGTLSGLILPVSAPFWAFALSGIIASTISFISLKNTSFCNIINPIAASGIIIHGLFGNFTNGFTAPFNSFSAFQWSVSDDTYITSILQSLKNGTDSITNSTLLNIFLGRDSGNIGEISSLLILIGGIYMIYKKYISWHLPISMIATVFLISFFFPVGNCEAIYCAAAETLSGGVFFCSFFIATLPSASPISNSGKIFFGICSGFITMLLRRFTPVADGTVFAIGIMSCFSFIIDFLTGNKYFSYLKDTKEELQPKKIDLESLLKDE